MRAHAGRAFRLAAGVPGGGAGSSATGVVGSPTSLASSGSSVIGATEAMGNGASCGAGSTRADLKRFFSVCAPKETPTATIATTPNAAHFCAESRAGGAYMRLPRAYVREAERSPQMLVRSPVVRVGET
jgi:hypothetical protein